MRKYLVSVLILVSFIVAAYSADVQVVNYNNGQTVSFIGSVQNLTGYPAKSLGSASLSISSTTTPVSFATVPSAATKVIVICNNDVNFAYNETPNAGIGSLYIASGTPTAFGGTSTDLSYLKFIGRASTCTMTLRFY